LTSAPQFPATKQSVQPVHSMLGKLFFARLNTDESPRKGLQDKIKGGLNTAKPFVLYA
jgi:hypothetical protein